MTVEILKLEIDAKELMSELREEMRQVFHAGWDARDDPGRYSGDVNKAWDEFAKETFGDA